MGVGVESPTRCCIQFPVSLGYRSGKCQTVNSITVYFGWHIANFGLAESVGNRFALFFWPTRALVYCGW